MNSQKNSGKLESSNIHEPVLLQEVLAALALEKDHTVVDATIGGAGHLRAIAGKLSKKGTLIGIDADDAALARAEEALAGVAPTVHLVHGNFRSVAKHLETVGIAKVNGALFDLGWSSFHLTSGRGFSFKADEPLLMTYGSPEDAKLTAYDLVNTLSENELADIIFAYGEERFARRIAERIVREREGGFIATAQALAEVVTRAVPIWYRHRRTHPATKTFQALRIAVNDELDALREALDSTLNHLEPGGRIAVITFHSIEDRIVKRAFERYQHEGKGTLATKKPIVPTKEELENNPRARSAKLRTFISS